MSAQEMKLADISKVKFTDDHPFIRWPRVWDPVPWFDFLKPVQQLEIGKAQLKFREAVLKLEIEGLKQELAFLGSVSKILGRSR